MFLRTYTRLANMSSKFAFSCEYDYRPRWPLGKHSKRFLWWRKVKYSFRTATHPNNPLILKFFFTVYSIDQIITVLLHLSRFTLEVQTILGSTSAYSVPLTNNISLSLSFYKILGQLYWTTTNLKCLGDFILRHSIIRNLNNKICKKILIWNQFLRSCGWLPHAITEKK